MGRQEFEGQGFEGHESSRTGLSGGLYASYSPLLQAVPSYLRPKISMSRRATPVASTFTPASAVVPTWPVSQAVSGKKKVRSVGKFE
jgi:hypothetical protein